MNETAEWREKAQGTKQEGDGRQQAGQEKGLTVLQGVLDPYRAEADQ